MEVGSPKFRWYELRKLFLELDCTSQLCCESYVIIPAASPRRQFPCHTVHPPRQAGPATPNATPPSSHLLPFPSPPQTYYPHCAVSTHGRPRTRHPPRSRSGSGSRSRSEASASPARVVGGLTASRPTPPPAQLYKPPLQPPSPAAAARSFHQAAVIAGRQAPVTANPPDRRCIHSLTAPALPRLPGRRLSPTPPSARHQPTNQPTNTPAPFNRTDTPRSSP